MKSVLKTNVRTLSTAQKGNKKNEYERIPRDIKDDDILKQEILRAALNHVNTKGWTIDAIRAGKITDLQIYILYYISRLFS